MAGRVWWACAAGVALLGVAAACRQIVGIGDEPPTDLAEAGAPRVDAGMDAEAGPTIVYAGASCEACLQHDCAAQATACAGETACSGLEGCLGSCDGGDPDCRALCVDQHRIGPDPAEIQLAACLAAHCEQPCGLTCGGLAQYFGPDAAAGCQTCMLDKACTSARECARNPECQGFAWCSETNQFGDRRSACQAPFDAGQDAFSSAVVALQACQNDCALGNQWYCVGSPPHLSGTGKNTTLFLSLYDYQSKSLPIADATVAVCSPTDPTCSQVLWSGTTGADGRVTLTIPPSALNTGVTGYIQITGAGLLPELFFWGYPLSEATITVAIPTISQTEKDAFVKYLGTLHVPVDLSSHAIVAAGALDCQITTAPDIEFTVSPSYPDAGTRVLYYSSLFINPTAESTDSTGSAIIVNVPPGQITLTATSNALGGRTVSNVSGFARSGEVTLFLTEVNQ